MSREYIAHQNNETIYFQEIPVTGDGDCAFTALGATRQAVADTLMAYATHTEIRQRFQEEIIQVITTNELPSLKTAESTKLYQAWNKHGIDISDYKRRLLQTNPQLENLNPDEFINQLPNEQDHTKLLKMQRHEVQAHETLEQYCSSETVFKAYISEGIMKELWLGYQGIQLFCEAKKINLCIWVPDAKKTDTLILKLESKV